MNKKVLVLVDFGIFEKNEILEVVSEHGEFYNVRRRHTGDFNYSIKKSLCEDFEPSFLDEYLNGGKKTDKFDYAVFILMLAAFGYMLVYILIKIGGAL